MKRIVMIAVLAVLLISNVGVGVVSAQETTELPPEFRVMKFDVTANEAVAGTINVNLQQETFVLNAHGLTPGAKMWLYCQVAGHYELIDSAWANEDGDLHIQGSWSPGVDLTASASPTFDLFWLPRPGEFSPWDVYIHSGYIITPFSTAVMGYLHVGRWMTDPIFGDTEWVSYCLPGQLITVYRWSEKQDTWVYWGEDTTNEDGYFKIEKAFSYRSNFKVVYEGGIYNGENYYDAYDFPTYGDPLAGY